MQEYDLPQARALVYMGFGIILFSILQIFTKLELLGSLIIGIVIAFGGHTLQLIEDKFHMGEMVFKWKKD